eukprot:TRINITY_DN2099_c0_g2_i1.p1 TRINITY_DN2099_c0_g2~~TRINITY_DN2099_c0_g2_i1.p1  ORF type:complete len:896 (+),score=233.16 TRINITY_DN2099_c0_g2_i1:61-2748(+)
MSRPGGPLRRGGVLLYEFFHEVSVRPRSKEQRNLWHSMPKYFKRAPRHGYAHKWMPTVSAGTGQDVDVDPYDRIEKRGRYTEMLQNWQAWYNIHNLLSAKAAPKEPGLVARDLAAHGVRLGDTQSSVLMWLSVGQVEDALAKGLPQGKVRDALHDAKLLMDALKESHTVSLETGSAIASLYALGGQSEQAEALEVELRHLLQDPEVPLKAKRAFYESVCSAHAVQKYDGARCLHWLGWMKQLSIRPSANHVHRLLHHMNRHGDYIRMLEVKENVAADITLQERHYDLLLAATAKQGQPDAAGKLLLEMKHQNLMFSTQDSWTHLLEAYHHASDLEGVLSRWRDLKHTSVYLRNPIYQARRRRRGKKLALQGFFKPSVRALLAVLRTFAAKKEMRAGYAWWRREVLSAGTGFGADRTSHFAAVLSKGKAGWTDPVLKTMLRGLLAEGATAEACELYDAVYTKTRWQPQLDGNQLFLEMSGRSRQGQLRVFHPDVWHLSSVALAKEGRLEEAHFALTLLRGTRETEGGRQGRYVHLLEACAGVNDGLMCATVELMQREKVPLDGDGYILVAVHLVALGDVPGATAVYAEMKAQRAFPTTASRLEGFVRLLAGGAPPAPEAPAGQLLRAFYVDIAARHGAQRAAADPPALPAFSDADAEPEADDPLRPAILALGEVAPWLPDIALLTLHTLPGFAALPGESVWRSRDALLTALGRSAVEGARRAVVYVADGTVAHHMHLLPDGAVLIPQAVLMQLRHAAALPAATQKEQVYFRESLAAFRDYVDDALAGFPDEGAGAPPPRPSPLRSGVVASSAEAACGANPAVHVPMRVVQLAGHLTKALSGRVLAVVATNDVEMVAFCRKHGVPCEVLAAHPRERLGLPARPAELLGFETPEHLNT